MKHSYAIERQQDGKLRIRMYYYEYVGESNDGLPIIKPAYKVIAEDLEIIDNKKPA